MLAPSKAKLAGSVPTLKLPKTMPSLARSLVTVLLPKFATQMLAPSKHTPRGSLPTAKEVVVLTLYHLSSATLSGFEGGGLPDGAAGWVAAVCADKQRGFKTENVRSTASSVIARVISVTS